MIRLELEFATTEEFLDALGKLHHVGSGPCLKTPLSAPIDAGATCELAEDAVSTRTEETVVAEKRKRRTKAEIAADEAAEALRNAQAGEPKETSSSAPAEEISPDDSSADADWPDGENEPADFESARTNWEADAFPAYKAKYPSAEPDAGTFMRVLLQKIVDKIGMDKAREFMVGFGYGRVSEIPADKRDDFFVAVNGVLGA
jgi:hypothetical protein